MGRWSPTSKAIEPYTRVSSALKSPDDLYKEFPRYRKNWTPAKISHLARLVIQTSGGSSHPFTQAVQKHFSTFQKDYPGTLPEILPTPTVLYKLREMQRNKLLGTFIKPAIAEAQAKIQLAAYRKGLAAATRKTAAPLRQNMTLHKNVTHPEKVPDVVNLTKSTSVQTDVTIAALKQSSTQTAPNPKQRQGTANKCILHSSS